MMKDDISVYLKSVYLRIGKNISNLRGRMSQDELAEKSGVSRSTVYAIEQGKSTKLETLVRLANALNVDPATLFREIDQQEIQASFNSYVQALVREEIKIILEFVKEINDRLEKIEKKI